MGSSYFGIPKMGNSSSSSSSRKSKKSSSDKPKQPQRGLGVAQLEQIRLRTQMGCNGYSTSSTAATFHQEEDMRLQGVPNNYGVQQSSTSYNPYYSSQSSPPTSSYAHHPNFMMVFGDHDRSNLRYEDSQPSNAPRWNPNCVLESSTYTQSDTASRHRSSYFEDSRHQRIDFLKSMGSSGQNAESMEHEEVDLELRLSL